MISSIELQVISKILTSDSQEEVNSLLTFDQSYYAVFNDQINFIFDHRDTYGDVPDVFTFQAQFPDINIVKVTEPHAYLVRELKRNKKQIILRETFNKLKDLGSDDVNEAWQYLSMQCDRADSLDEFAPMDIVHDAKQRSDQILSFANQTRIPTGFKEIDNLMYGGLSTVEELLLVVARTNTGKAQPLWSKILTPNGWIDMGHVKVGDVVIGRDNDRGTVVEIFPQGVIDYYRVNFDDGTSSECSKDHLWEVLDSSRRTFSNPKFEEFMTLTTDQIVSSLDNNYSVELCGSVVFDDSFDVDENIDGYLLGVILGCSCLRDSGLPMTLSDKQIWGKVEYALDKHKCHRSGSYSDRISGDDEHNFVRDKLEDYGLMGKHTDEKFVPECYKTAPVPVRHELLSGLLDTCGHISVKGGNRYEFKTTSEELAKDFCDLARSLNVKCEFKQVSSSRFKVCCVSSFNPFWVNSKRNRFHYSSTYNSGKRSKRICKKIKSIEYVGKTGCQCIMVDNRSHTYITDDYVVTHNTWVLTRMMETAQKNGFPVLYYSPEMQASYLGTRFDTWRGNFQNSEIYRGRYSESYLEYIKTLPEDKTSAFVLEDKDVSGGSVSVHDIVNMVKKHGIKLVIIDGLSYMEDDHRADKDYLRYKNICNDLFKMSKQFGCAVVVAMQANRETKANKDDKGDGIPTLYEIEGSDHPARICTQAFSLRQVFDQHVLDIQLQKSRNANNSKPTFSYSWDVNTGNCNCTGGEGISMDGTPQGMISMPTVSIGSSGLGDLDEDEFSGDDDIIPDQNHGEDDENVDDTDPDF